MKKYIWLMLLFLLFATASVVSAENTERTLHVNVDGQFIETDTSPVIKEGRMLVPLRTLSSLGLTYQWDNTAKRATIQNAGGDIIRVTASQRTAYKNNAAVTLDVPAQIMNGRIMVPVRFVSEQLGLSVQFENTRGLVFVSSPNYTGPKEALNGNDLVQARLAAISLPLQSSFNTLNPHKGNEFSYRFVKGEAHRYLFMDSLVYTMVEIREDKAHILFQYVDGAPNRIARSVGDITEDNRLDKIGPFIGDQSVSFFKQSNKYGTDNLH
ncbi:copper amine oxidase N-terminal domain-containing protein [Bacillus horti]|uniref:Copper amine oxidase-like N-terminal domain-containing protein n=1 Tax=Caldalkalibacillus horti TaxID=77523 RepID=A0ABT9W367_9BACI|nr:copper amine oxidase N-terminal domain-containing protein [Bacillus horti]MDQ0167694.1 hypothetical protein [Bacillus horti]